MRYTRVAAVASAAVLAVSMAACGSSEKTVDQQASSGTNNAGALIGVTMPTRSSERWISDGD
ncbi:sugar ABC transporter substrate-binding protein, partial [Actinoplanes sp. NPDC051633]